MTNACSITAADTFRCPSRLELFTQILKLLPRGRAWATHEDTRDALSVSGATAQHGTYELGGQHGLGSEAWIERLTVMQRYWLSFADVLAYLHERACRLVEEMFCETTAELRAEWGHEYGFPDACEPWDTLCDKVRAQGGATCAYLASLAARVGYEAECVECIGGTVATCATADCAVASCACHQSVIRIRIRGLAPSAPPPTPFKADAAVADCTPQCPPDPAPAEPPAIVVCLIERFKPAHVKAIYEVV